MPRLALNLKKDRNNGEFFPQISGQFFYCEATDLPCRISFNGNDDSQSVGLSSGFQMNMPFSGFTLFHDDYSQVGSATNKFSLIVYTSREPRAFNQYVNPTVQSQIPYSTTGIIGSTLKIKIPCFQRSRFLSFQSVIVTNSVADPGVLQVSGIFNDAQGNSITGPTNLTKNGITYNVTSATVPFNVVSRATGAANSWAWDFKQFNVAIPSNSDNFDLQMFWYTNLPGTLSNQSHYINIS